MDTLALFALRFLEISALLFVCLIGITVLALIYMYFVDKSQTRHAIK